MTFPTNTAAYVDTPWTDPATGIQWIYDASIPAWARYRVAGGGVSSFNDLTDVPAALTAPQAAATPSIRKIGTGATDAAAGNHPHADLTDATSLATASKLAKRDAYGGCAFIGCAVETLTVNTAGFGKEGITRGDNITTLRTYQEPNASGVKALTADTQGRPDALFDATISGTLTINSTTITFGTGAAAAMRTAGNMAADYVAPVDTPGDVTIVLTHHNTTLRMTAVSGTSTITINVDGTTNYPAGFRVFIKRHGAGTLAFAATGWTVNNNFLSAVSVGGWFCLQKTATPSTWDMI